MIEYSRRVVRLGRRLRRRLVPPSFGPLNGQLERQHLVASIIAWFEPATIFETGTYLGSSTAWFAERSPGWVRSVEANGRLARRAARKLRAHQRVEVVHADSAEQLHSWAQDDGVDHERCLFYLDAHWQARNPLLEELAAIRAGWRRSIVLIDDAEVPDDPGYGFDPIAGVGSVGLALLAGERLQGLDALVPAVRSEAETGHRRGMLVLAEPGDARAMLERFALRPHP